MNHERNLVKIFVVLVFFLTLPLAVMDGAIVFSVDFSWVSDAVSTVVFKLVVANVDDVVDASVVNNHKQP